MSTRNYEELSIIGKGAYGTVFKAIDRDNGRTVALKRVRIINNTEEKGVPVSTLREITLLKQLDNISHPNIVRLFDAFQTYSTTPTDSPSDLVLTIVFEHVNQDLSQFLRSCPQPGLPEELIKDLMHQLLSGIDYLHVNRMVHRDIKPQNVLITKNRQVKIADFGLARVYGFCKLVTSVVVTLWYRAPEILLQVAYATMVDVWSVGAIMAEMYNRRPLFPGKGEVDQLQRILSVIGSPERDEWPDNASLPWESFKQLAGIDFRHLVTEMCPEGLELIKKLLTFDPNKRLSAKECLNHAYFNDVERPDTQDGPSLTTCNQLQKRQKQECIYNSNSTSSLLAAKPSYNKTKKQSTSMSHLIDSFDSHRSLEKEESSCASSNTLTSTDSTNEISKQKHQMAFSRTCHDDSICYDRKPNIQLGAELSRSDSGLGDSFPEHDQRSFSRADSGICVSPLTVYSDDHESSNSSNSFDQSSTHGAVISESQRTTFEK